MAQERISRRKHTGEFPHGAIRSCLEQAGMQPSEVDAMVHSFDYQPYRTMYALDPISSERYRDVLSPEAFIKHVQAPSQSCQPST